MVLFANVTTRKGLGSTIGVAVAAAMWAAACGGGVLAPDASAEAGVDAATDAGADGDASNDTNIAVDASVDETSKSDTGTDVAPDVWADGGGADGSDARPDAGADVFSPQCPPVAPKSAPQDLYIVVDRTTPMAPYLDELKATLATTLQNLSAAFPDINVGLDYFPSQPDVDVCERNLSANVPMMPLSTGLTVLQSSLAALVSGGKADVGVGAEGAYARAQAWASAHPGRHASVLFATAATDTIACTEIDDAMYALWRGAWGYYTAESYQLSSIPGPSVSTFAIGVGADKTKYTFAVGGDLVMLGGSVDANAKAILDMLVSDAGCTLQLPVQDRSPQSLSGINVQLVSAQGGELLNQQDVPVSCDGADGWFYNSVNDPWMISLCPKSCSRLHQLPAGRVELTVGCASRCEKHACDDGVDNDRDNLIDLADPQCRYSCRNYEGTIE